MPRGTLEAIIVGLGMHGRYAEGGRATAGDTWANDVFSRRAYAWMLPLPYDGTVPVYGHALHTCNNDFRPTGRPDQGGRRHAEADDHGCHLHGRNR
jgi:hypothetical protein